MLGDAKNHNIGHNEKKTYSCFRYTFLTAEIGFVFRGSGHETLHDKEFFMIFIPINLTISEIVSISQ